MCMCTRFQTDQSLSHHGDGAYRSRVMLNPHDATQQSDAQHKSSRPQAGSDDCILGTDGINAAVVAGGVSSQITDSDRPSIYT